MMSSAALLLGLGLLLTFDPDGLVAYTGTPAQPLITLLAQAAGALYLGFAILNWMAKDNLIGGIYSRPVALGNLLHFFITAMTLLRFILSGAHATPLLVLGLVYTVFTVWFGLVVFGSPVGRRHA